MWNLKKEKRTEELQAEAIVQRPSLPIRYKEIAPAFVETVPHDQGNILESLVSLFEVIEVYLPTTGHRNFGQAIFGSRSFLHCHSQKRRKGVRPKVCSNRLL